MSTFKVRIAEKSEIDWINKCYDEVGFVHSIFENEIIVVAEYNNQKAGIGRLVKVDSSSLELGGIYTLDAFRGKGIARKVIEFLLRQAGTSKNIYCIPFEHLANFYQEFGFKPCSPNVAIPKELQKKYEWCKTTYQCPTLLLKLINK